MGNKKSKIGIFFIILIVLLLIASIGLNICYYMFPDILPWNTKKDNLEAEQYINTVVKDENMETSDHNSNTIANTENSISSQNQIENSTVVDLSVETKNDEIRQDELKTLIEQYAVGIQRIDNEFETTEGNTALLFIAKKYFDTNVGTKSLNIDTKYTQTAENYNKYLSELTNTDYTKREYIDSFSNYIGYSKDSKSYILGKNSSTITKEKYNCTAVDVINKTDDINTGRAIVTRTVDDVKTIYQITFKFKVNKNYEYQKYKILSLNAVNSSFYPDNTVHLVKN